MTRKYGWILSLALLVMGRASAQERVGVPPKTDTPIPPPLIQQPAPMAEAPVTEAFEPAGQARSVPFSLRLDFLNWWMHRDQTPALLNTSPVNKTNNFAAGTADDRQSRTLVGTGNSLSYATVPGMRIGFAIPLAEQSCWAFEADGLVLDRRQADRSFTGANGAPLLTRPFYDPIAVANSGYDTSGPGGTAGTINFQTRAQFWGYEANLSFVPDESVGKVSKLLVGFRYLDLHESLDVLERVRATGGAPGDFLSFNTIPVPAGTDVVIGDHFGAQNRFYGPQVGAVFSWCSGPFGFDLSTKIAAGLNHETVQVYGNTSTMLAPAARAFVGVPVPVSTTGGVLANRANSGFFSRDEFTLAPELALKFRFEATSWARIHAGYNIIYLSSAVRPGTQIDGRIDHRNVPSDVDFRLIQPADARFPRPFFRDTDFFAHGVNFGLEFHW